MDYKSSMCFFYFFIVFTELPPGQTNFKEGCPALLTCELKAPSDSVVYWTQKQGLKQECQIPTVNMTSSTNDARLCNTTAVVKNRRKSIDDTFSLFHVELEVSDYRLILGRTGSTGTRTAL